MDPAIISSQLRGTQNNRQPGGKSEEGKAQTPTAPKPSPSPNAETKGQEVKSEAKETATGEAETKSSEAKPNENPAAASKPSSGGTVAADAANAVNGPDVPDVTSATATVEVDVLKHFRNFATQQRVQADRMRTNKIKQDTQVKLQELKKFATSFKLSTPVPNDLISIIAKDPAKQKQIQDKAMQNAKEVLQAKETAQKDKATSTKEGPSKPAGEQGPPLAPVPAAGDSRANTRPGAAHHTSSPSGVPNRPPGGRQSYAPAHYNQQSFRHDRSPAQHGGGPRNGTLAERLRKVEQDKYSRPPPHHQQQQQQQAHFPPPPAAPGVDPNFGRRLSAVPPAHMAKLNPNSHEFRPSAFAVPFNPNGPSAGSSPRSATNNVAESQPATSLQISHLVRRKTKATDVSKCCILAHIKTIQPSSGRNFDDNNGLRPSYDTPPTWRQLQDTEPADSIMRLTYREFFEKIVPFSATPSLPHAVPQIAHQHQLPFHLQGGPHAVPRQSPHMPPMQMHTGGHTHVPHISFSGGGDDHHRMVPSSSAQSYASPRMTQVAMYPPQMNSTHMPYSQPVAIPGFLPGTPQMNQYRNFNPQYLPQQSGPMGVPMMPPQPFVAGPSNMMPGGPQMSMFQPGHGQYMTAAAGTPSQPMPGSNGYPSPGRPAATMMAQQGSQQGQPMYGVSPSMQYQQPVFTPQHPGQSKSRSLLLLLVELRVLTVGISVPMRGYSNPGPGQYGTSPQQMHQFGPQHRSGSNSYNKNFQGHNHQQHQGPQGGHAAATGPQSRAAPDGPEEAK